MLCGVFCETMALIGASLSKQIWHLYLSFGICLGWGIDLQYIATVGIVPNGSTGGGPSPLASAPQEVEQAG